MVAPVARPLSVCRTDQPPSPEISPASQSHHLGDGRRIEGASRPARSRHRPRERPDHRCPSGQGDHASLGVPPHRAVSTRSPAGRGPWKGGSPTSGPLEGTGPCPRLKRRPVGLRPHRVGDRPRHGCRQGPRRCTSGTAGDAAGGGQAPMIDRLRDLGTAPEGATDPPRVERRAVSWLARRICIFDASRFSRS